MKKLVIKGNKVRVNNGTAAVGASKGGALGAVLGILLQAGAAYLGFPIPEEIAAEAAVGLASVIGAVIGAFRARDPQAEE
jgi:hypothetical protein